MQQWIRQATTRGLKVMGMIMPSVFEGMLNFLMISMKADLYRWYEDQTWKGAWIRFARSLLPKHTSILDENETDEAEFYEMHQSGLGT